MRTPLLSFVCLSAVLWLGAAGCRQGGSGGDGGGQGGTPCGQGVLFAGSPESMNQNGVPPDGTPIRSEPVLPWQGISFVGKIAYTTTPTQLWSVDTTAANPVEHVTAGQAGSAQFAVGPCASARFGQTSGIAVLSDGSLVMTDYGAGALVSVQDPHESTCTITALAGTAPPFDFSGGDSPAMGDQDGAGAMAVLYGPQWPVAGPGDVVYFYDSGNSKVKKLAADAAHTVSTVAVVPGVGDTQNIYSMTLLAGKLYLPLVNSDGTASIIEIDAASGAVRNLVSGDESKFAGATGTPAQPAGLTTDGMGLFAIDNGDILYITPAGQVNKVAGNDNYMSNFPSDYDPSTPHPAQGLALAGTYKQVNLAWNAGSLYFVGQEEATYVEKIACP